MKTQNQNSTRRLALVAALLLLAVTASSCGVALPTQPDMNAGVQASRTATTNGAIQGEEMNDNTNPAGGQDMTNAPPAGEVPVPVLGGHVPSGNAWGHYKTKHNPK